MRILHLLYESRGDFFGIGGAGCRAYDIYGYLKSRHDITLLCKRYPGARDGTIDGLKHLFAGIESKNLTMTFLSYAVAGAAFVKRYGDAFDIIVEDFSPAIPTFLNFFTRRPLVLQVQGFTGALYFRKYNPVSAAVLSVMERLRPRLYDNVVVIGEETARRLAIPTGRNVGIISNGVPKEMLDAAPAEESYILYLGRIDIYGKGLDILLDAYRGFHSSFPEIRLVVAGDGRDRGAFEASIMQMPDRVRRNIELTGWVSGERKIELLRRAMFCLVPSRHDVQSIAVLEAMACAKPVIVSDIPELTYVTDHSAGMSFATGNARSLLVTMEKLAGSSARREMGCNGRKWVKDYTLDKVALRYEMFLQDVLKRVKSGSY